MDDPKKATFVLIPGAGGDAWYWSRLVPELERRGHDAVAVDIREDDPALGLPEYTQTVLDAIGAREDVVLVGQSLGGFTVPVVAAQRPPRAIVLVNAMIPLPSETPGEWWNAVGQPDARSASDQEAGRDGTFDPETYFLHDLPDDTLAEAYRNEPHTPADTPFGQPCEFTGWPDCAIHVVVGADDRFFPPNFQRRVAKERLGVDADVIAGGHLLALANPAGLSDQLVSYL